MEENENKNVEVNNTTTEPAAEVKAEPTATSEPEVETTARGVKGMLKSKKNLIIGIIVAIILVICVYNIFFNTKGKAVSAIKNYLTAYGSGKYQKAMKTIDPAGSYVFKKLDKDEYEDFWQEYKEFKKSDDYDDVMDEWKESLEDAKEMEEDFDKDDKTKVKIKKVTKFKKVGKNLYEVKVKVEAKHDGDEDTSTLTFYVMKSGLGCKLVSAGF